MEHIRRLVLNRSTNCGPVCETSKDIHLSKSLSWLLRHGAVKEGLALSPEGYINVDRLLQHKSLKQYNLCDIERVVRNNDKQRFTLRVNPTSQLLEIKANQGHSIQISDAELTPITTAKYKTVVHGTYTKCWPQIRQTGLSRMRRNHIHFAKGTDSTVISGLRTNAQIYIYVDLQKALEDGFKFYESDNGVILTPGNDKGFLETKYFDRVVEGVTGYPPYTKAQELAHVFCRFGDVRLNFEWVTDSGACLEFGTPEQARAAIAASRRLHLYGAALTVRPCTAHTRPQRAQRRRPPRVPHGNKGVTVEASSIPLEGPFAVQLAALLARVSLSAPELARRAQLYADLEHALQDVWPGCRAVPFGSVTTGLGVQSSDADCFVALPARAAAGAVARAARALQLRPRTFADLLPIPRANTPIVKFLHLPTRVYCDLSFKTSLGARNSELVAFLLHADPRLVPAALVIKYWARVHDLTGTGKLTNYALTMLVLFYLQRARVLPPVAALQRDPAAAHVVDSWNAGFARDPLPPGAGDLSVPELLGGFFDFYAGFDFDRFVVCPYLGRPIEKDAFRDPALLPEEFALYKRNVAGGVAMPLRFMTPLCVQDPFEQCHNVASPVTARLVQDIRAFFKFAAEHYERDRADGCVAFLRHILLQRPALPRAAPRARFRLRLPPAPLAHAPPAWRRAVRDVTFQIFESLLRIKLEVSEEERRRRAGAKGEAAEPPAGRPAGAIEPREEARAPEEKTGGDERAPLPLPAGPADETRAGEGERPAAGGGEKPGSGRARERECYSARLSRAVWKRKRFPNKEATMAKFPERETIVTDDILRLDPAELRVQLQVVLTFTDAPRGAFLDVRYLAGDLAGFKEFGHFLSCRFNNWFVLLFDPQAPEPEPALDYKEGPDSDSDTDSYEDERVPPKLTETDIDFAKLQSVIDEIDKNNTDDAVRGGTDKNEGGTDKKTALKNETVPVSPQKKNRSPRHRKGKDNPARVANGHLS